jgi:hypothetical protein
MNKEAYMLNYPIGEEFIITIKNCAIVQGYFTQVTEESVSLLVLDVLTKNSAKSTIPRLITVNQAEILKVEKVETKILKPFRVTWYDSELKYEDSEIVHARCWQDAETAVSEGNQYAVDIWSEEIKEEVNVL